MEQTSPPSATVDTTNTMPLQGCRLCGQVQQVPNDNLRYGCARCGHPLPQSGARRRELTAILAVTGLIIFPLAVTLPVMTISRFGSSHSAGVLDGSLSLLRHGDIIVGLTVLLASVVFPFIKLLLLLLLDFFPRYLQPQQRGRVWLLLEITGRWGMLDVLLVAVMVAVLKLGDLFVVKAGPGAILFTALVVISLAAAAVFDPRALWDAQQSKPSGDSSVSKT